MEAYAEQAKYNAQFDAMMAREKICKVRLLPGDVPAHEEPEIVEAAPCRTAGGGGGIRFRHRLRGAGKT